VLWILVYWHLSDGIKHEYKTPFPVAGACLDAAKMLIASASEPTEAVCVQIE